MGERNKKVLIIDDDPDFVRSTGMILKSAGYEVLEAFSGKEGLEKSESEKPDLYIIDLMMETYSEGSKVAEALSANEETKNKPRIMMTAVDLKGPWDSYPGDNRLAYDFILQKPVAPENLLKYVEKALGKK